MVYQTIPKKYEKKVSNLKIAFCRLGKSSNNNDTKSVFCHLLKEKTEIEVNQLNYPHLCKILLQYHQSKSLVSRRDKFLNLYMIYEVSVKDKKEEYSAIRHALAHESSRLTQRKTLEILDQLFGTHILDLNNKKHRDVFYKYFIELLIDVDQILFTELTVKR